MLTNEKITQIQELYNKGMMKKDIAKELNISLPTISKYTKNIKVEYDNMVGKQFGELTVIKRADKNPSLKSRCIRYICKCSCGKIIEVNGNSLRTGHTISCGCSRKGINIKDLSNQRFGKLTALYIEGFTKDRHAIWKCKCDCGNEYSANSKYLINGDVNSCGCLKRSMGEIQIDKFLKELNIEYKTEYIIEECKYKKPLRFDFAIFEKNQLLCLIEYQGEIHYKSTGGWNSKENFDIRQERDNIKREFCKDNNIKLIEISYTEYNNLSSDFLRSLIYD